MKCVVHKTTYYVAQGVRVDSSLCNDYGYTFRYSSRLWKFVTCKKCLKQKPKGGGEMNWRRVIKGRDLERHERQKLNRIYQHLSAEQADHREKCRGLDNLFDDLPFVFQCLSKLMGEPTPSRKD